MAARKGDGSIFWREDRKRWVTMVTLPDGTRRTFYGRELDDVKLKLKQAQAHVTKNEPVPSGRETVGAFLARWLKDVASQRVRATTLLRYRFDVERRLIPGLGKLRLTELTPKAVQAFISDLTAAGPGARSVAHGRAVLRTALTQAAREGLIG